MRRLLLAVSILLHCFAARGGERVSIATPLVTLAPSDARLHEWCAAEGKFDACTRFVGFRLDAGCSYDGRAWRMAASATFRPYIVLRNMHSLPHEYLHIGDIRQAVEALAATLGSTDYTSEPQCRQQALSEAAAFESNLRAFARKSNAMRHPDYVATSP